MKFKSLRIQNFMSVEDVEISLDSLGLVLIQGSNNDTGAFESNGSGKSTIFSEAPTWALFGETIRGQKGDGVVNRSAGKNTLVELTIEDDNKDIYVVTRHRKHSKHKNHVFITLNGKDITAKSDTDTTNMISELLQMDFQTFTSSIMFGQGTGKMFAMSTDSEQKKILEKMLQIDVLKKCQTEAKNRLSSAKSTLNSLEKSLEDEERNLESYKNSLKSWKEKEELSRENLGRELQDIDNRIEEYSNLIEVAISSKETNKSKADECMDMIDICSKSIKEHSNIRDKKEELESKISKYSRERDRYSDELQDKLESFKNIKAGNVPDKKCRSCGQIVPQDVSKILTDLNNDMRSLMSQVNNLDQLTDSAQEELDTIHLPDISKVRENFDRYTQELSEVKGTIKALDKEILHLNDAIGRLSKERQAKEESDASLFTEIIQGLESDIDHVSNKSIPELKESIKQSTSEVEGYEFWVGAYGDAGIKSVILNDITPYLNSRVNYYLNKLTDGTIEATFNTQSTTAKGEIREKFSVDIVNKNGDADYKGNSGGEKRRIDVAVNMALQDLVYTRANRKIDLVVYDECFEALDTIGCETVIQLLEEKAQKFGTVVVITHNDSLKQMFSEHLTVNKKAGTTSIC